MELTLFFKPPWILYHHCVEADTAREAAFGSQMAMLGGGKVLSGVAKERGEAMDIDSWVQVQKQARDDRGRVGSTFSRCSIFTKSTAA